MKGPFAGAAGTATFAGLLFATTLLESMLHVPYLLDLAIDPYLSRWRQWWRLLANNLIWTDQTQLFLGILILYNSRVVERFYSTGRWVVMVIAIWLASALLVPFLLYLVRARNFVVTPGPTALLGAIVQLYSTYVPSIYRFKIEGLGSVSDKVWVYLFAFQLIRSRGDLLKFFIGWSLVSIPAMRSMVENSYISLTVDHNDRNWTRFLPIG